MTKHKTYSCLPSHFCRKILIGMSLLTVFVLAVAGGGVALGSESERAAPGKHNANTFSFPAGLDPQTL